MPRKSKSPFTDDEHRAFLAAMAAARLLPTSIQPPTPSMLKAYNEQSIILQQQ